MGGWRGIGAVVAATATAAAAVVFFTTGTTRQAPQAKAASGQPSTSAVAWPTRHTQGSVRLTGHVPLAIANNTAKPLGRHPANADIGVNFAFPIRDQAALNTLIAQEAKTHVHLTRAQLYARFSPPAAQLTSLESWLTGHGFTITHVGADRLSVAAHAPTSVVEKSLHVQIDDFMHGATSFRGLAVNPYRFYSNTSDPQLPARFGVQTISGLTDVDRFFTDAQLAKASTGGPQSTDTRSGGYWPSDIRSLYDVAGHGYDGTGQTLGFTLWGAGERQAAMTAFATATGDQLITVDPPCTETGNSPTSPGSCTTQSVAGDHLLSILENGNTNNQFGGNVETALDIEQAHGIATHAALKYYLADCTASPPAGSGLTNGSSCNGSDVGLEEAVEDAANDPTLHTVSNSWAFGGEAEWGNVDPFLTATQNSLAIGAAAGTTFYFSTGDSGTYQSGYPSDSPYVVGVGGTTLFSTSSPSTLSTENTWAAGGSWCSNIEARPSWQNGPGVAANAPCPGRVIPDISAVADTNSAVRFISSTNATGGTQSGSVGGTSVAAPELNGMTAVLENFIAAQTYSGPAPQIGFTAPVMYQMGNSGHYDSYFRDVYCGNTANPASGPDGDAAQPGWDAATGWGAIDWLHFATGYAITLGANGLSIPSSLNNNYKWTCARTPGNSSERGLAFGPSGTTGYAVGAASGSTPWYAKFLASGSWGAVNTFYKTTDGGATWVPANSDMTSIACTSTTTCVEVGDGGVIKRTSDGGATWNAVQSPDDKALTEVRCPDASTCYAAGDRGTVLKSTDGGLTWAYTASADGNPLYGLDCPTATVCYATDIYAHVMKTTNGGASWTMEQTPVTTPGVAVPGSGGPNPFAGLFGVSCVDVNTCVAVGGYPPIGTDPPIVTTSDGGTTWTLRTSNSGSGNYLHAVTCIQGSTTCYAVGRGGSIVTTSDMVNWTKMTSGTTNALNSIVCSSITSCVASGQNGTVDVLSGSTWTATTGNGGTNFLAGVSCPGFGTCYAAGKQGVTVASHDGGATWTLQAGGGTTQQMNAVSCPSDTGCVTVGNAGTIIQTTNGGQTWLARTSGTTSNLNGVSCPTGTNCVAVGAAGTIKASVDGGTTWTASTSGTTQALNGVSCANGICVAVGAAGTILRSTDNGATWAAQTSGTTVALSAVACTTNQCTAVGAISGTTAVILGSTDGGVTWTAETSNAPQALTSVACIDDFDCYAGGAIGTVVATNDGGVTWTQQGNPLSGPVTALNAGPTGITAINAAACSATRCDFGTASSGNILTTPLLKVAVNTSSQWGQDPGLSAIPASDPALTYTPASEAGNVTGTLSCQTTASSSAPVGVYPITACSGLDDQGYNVVYDYGNSSHTIVLASQSISFAPLPDLTWGDLPFTLSATASSGLPVSFAVSGNCSLGGDGVTVTLTGAGSCTVTASQAGNEDYAAATSVQQTFAIAQAAQSIAFTGPNPATFGDPDFTISPTASSGLPVSVSVTSGPCTLSASTAPADVHITGAGRCVIDASQPGDSNYLPADDVSRSFDIAKADQTITFGSLADHSYGDPDFTVSATASSGLAVSFTAAGDCTVTGSTVHIVDAGSCTITASQPGDDNWNPAADVPQTFQIGKESQTISFAPLANKTFGSPDFTVSATASSGLPVTFAASGTCTLSGATVHITGSGSCTVTASQAGNGDWAAATPVSRTFSVVNSIGTATGNGLLPVSGGVGNFAVVSTSRGLAGALTFVGPVVKPARGHRPTPPERFTALKITSFGITPSGNGAWIAGVGLDGRAFLAYVENGPPPTGHHPKLDNDVFELWIGGVAETGDGSLRHGNVTVHAG